MSEPVRTPPFAPFEWLLSGRYLRARRKEGFISVIAGFSFLGIMLGVATLIIVMAVMNGFRKELLDKILGVNGHLLVQPLESPLTDWKDVAERISQVAGIRLAAPVVDGQALASSPFNASGFAAVSETKSPAKKCEYPPLTTIFFVMVHESTRSISLPT